MKDPTNPVPDEEFSGKNLRDVPAILESNGYGVYEWTPEEDGRGKPEMVILALELGGEFDGAQIALRLKSRPEVNRLLVMLRRHRDGVWPLCRLCGATELKHGPDHVFEPLRGAS